MELKTEHGYMEITVDIYTGLVERSERLAVYEELMRGYNPVTVIIAGKKHIRKKQKKEERKEREKAAAAMVRERIQAAAKQADEESEALLASLRESEPVPACPDPGKMLSLLRAGWTKYDLAAEFNTYPETIVAWASRYSINPDKAEVPENE